MSFISMLLTVCSDAPACGLKKEDVGIKKKGFTSLCSVVYSSYHSAKLPERLMPAVN